MKESGPYHERSRTRVTIDIVEERVGDKSLSPAVSRAAAFLEVLADSPGPVGTTEIAERLNLPKSSVSNIGRALADTGLVSRINGEYRLGHRLLGLANAYLARINEVDAFNEVTNEVASDYEETLQLAVLSSDFDVVYLARRDGAQPVRLLSDIGRSLPANCTALGKALLARLDDAEVVDRAGRIGELKSLTSKSITDLDTLLAQLKQIRERGYAFDDEEAAEGVVCFARAFPVPLRQDGAAAVSTTVLKARLTPELEKSALDALEAIAERMSARFGA